LGEEIERQSWFNNAKSLYEIQKAWEPILGNTPVNSFDSGTTFPNILPISMMVASQTIGMDLVSVQPLSAPLNQFHWFDYRYEEPWSERIKKERDKKLERVFND
jgi:hypothetical protein